MIGKSLIKVNGAFRGAVAITNAPRFTVRQSYRPGVPLRPRSWPTILDTLAPALKQDAHNDLRGQHFAAGPIVRAVSRNLSFASRYRDREEMLPERSLTVDQFHRQPPGAGLCARH